MLRRLIRACCSVSVLALSSELVNKDAVKILGSSGIDLYRKLVGSTYVWESTEKCVTISVYIYIYIYGVYIYIYYIYVQLVAFPCRFIKFKRNASYSSSNMTPNT